MTAAATLEPALYVGTLRHRRRRPTQHEFRYSVFLAFLDIDRIPETMARAVFTSYSGFNWASFDERDHLGGGPQPLRARLAADAAAHGVALPDGPVYLLTNLRYWGYCFNPISLYYCFPREGGAPLVMAEVTSTFGERTHYWLAPRNGPGSALRYECAKALHVSPFMGMALHYDFALTQPGQALTVHMDVSEPGEQGAQSFFDATLALQRRPWTSGNLFGVLARHPWMTAKVMAAIHWEAARLWWKGTPVYTKPAGDSPAGISEAEKGTVAR